MSSWQRNQKPFGKATRTLGPLESIHSDICEYFITLIYDYSRYGYVYPLSHCYQALNVVKHFIVEVRVYSQLVFGECANYNSVYSQLCAN